MQFFTDKGVYYNVKEVRVKGVSNIYLVVMCVHKFLKDHTGITRKKLDV